MSSNVLRVEEGLSSLHQRSDLELSSVSHWIFWEVDSLTVDEPLLRWMVFAWVELHVFTVTVASALSTEANSGMIHKLSSSEGDLLVWIVGPWSDWGPLSWSMLISKSVGNCKVSLLPPSDRMGS